jgi:hypothetical protein
MTNLDQLTEIQRSIYDLTAQGLQPAEIAGRIGSTEALVKANITRIRGKGVTMPKPGEQPLQPPPNTVPVTNVLSQPPSKPAATGGSENDRIAAMVNQAGGAIDAKELAALADKVAGRAVRDIHPMILMGITIQFVKLCGGRMIAHQVIEDVYGALRSFVGNVQPDEGGEALPLPQTDKERLAFLEEQNKALLDEIRDLQAKVRSQNADTN